jgi:hypothetical protein
MWKKFFLCFLVCPQISFLEGAQITRVIIGCDTNPTYIQFWPLVARAWKQIVGIQPTLILIAEDEFPIDTTVGDVIRFKPIPGIATSFQAQVIRLLGATYFEHEVCLITDMDMIPCCRSYFLDSVKRVPDDCYIVYRNGHDAGRFPMCYNAAKGSVCKEVFGISGTQDIRDKIIQWAELGWGWSTDELVLTKEVMNYYHRTGKVAFLNHGVNKRIDRMSHQETGHLEYNKRALKKGEYIDFHLLRPFDQYRSEILEVVRDLGL